MIDLIYLYKNIGNSTTDVGKDSDSDKQLDTNTSDSSVSNSLFVLRLYQVVFKIKTKSSL